MNTISRTEQCRCASQSRGLPYYYHGLGVPNQPEKVRWEKAAGYYRSAADTQYSALAMWNPGWMCKHGYGVPQVCVFSYLRFPRD